MGKLQKVFYEQMQDYYSTRKYKEQITLNCASRCMQSFTDDDFNSREKQCLTNCFHKHYRYLAYANSLYSYLVADEQMDKEI